MYRHRRHASLDSSFSASSALQSFTLQSSGATAGQRTARLTAHTSPLALAPAISPPLPTHSEEMSVSEMEMEEEMERMVSSVVKSPTEMVATSAPRSPSALGLGLPSSMKNQHRRSWSGTPSSSRSLLSVASNNTESDPKTNMGMRAAFGNYRKRCLSVQTAVAQPPVPPAVMVSSASPTISTPPAIDPEPSSATSSFLLTPPTSPVVQPRPSLSNRGGSASGSGHRRAVSAGSLPSLDQIREWSQRRQTEAGQLEHVSEKERDEGYEEPIREVQTKTQVLVPARVALQSNMAVKKENRLDKVLRSRSSSSRLKASVSVPSTPIVQVTVEIPVSSPQEVPMKPQEEKRVECARQMVNVLGKRRSLTTMSNAGILA